MIATIKSSKREGTRQVTAKYSFVTDEDNIGGELFAEKCLNMAIVKMLNGGKMMIIILIISPDKKPLNRNNTEIQSMIERQQGVTLAAVTATSKGL